MSALHLGRILGTINELCTFSLGIKREEKQDCNVKTVLAINVRPPGKRAPVSRVSARSRQLSHVGVLRSRRKSLLFAQFGLNSAVESDVCF